jgi:hypothetical protein
VGLNPGPNLHGHIVHASSTSVQYRVRWSYADRQPSRADQRSPAVH